MKPWEKMHTIASDVTISLIIYIIYRLRLYPISSYYPNPIPSALSYKGKCIKSPHMNWDNPSRPSYITRSVDDDYINKRDQTFAICRLQLRWFILCYFGNPGIITVQSAIYLMGIEKHGQTLGIHSHYGTSHQINENTASFNYAYISNPCAYPACTDIRGAVSTATISCWTWVKFWVSFAINWGGATLKYIIMWDCQAEITMQH